MDGNWRRRGGGEVCFSLLVVVVLKMRDTERHDVM